MRTRPSRRPSAPPFSRGKCRETVAWAREILLGGAATASSRTTTSRGTSPIASGGALYSDEGTFQMQNLIVGKAITGLSAFV